MKNLSLEDVINMAKILGEIALAIVGYVQIRINPMLADKVIGPTIVFMLVSSMWIMLRSKKDYERGGWLVRKPWLSLIFALLSYLGAGIFIKYLDYNPPPKPYAGMADALIVILYVAAFSLLAISCSTLLRLSGIHLRS